MFYCCEYNKRNTIQLHFIGEEAEISEKYLKSWEKKLKLPALMQLMTEGKQDNIF